MTRYAIDAATAIRIVREGVAVHPHHQLVAPKALHSDALARLYREVRDGSTDDAEARAVLDGITTMKIRLLGDRVSRGTAWKIARALDWPEIAHAEYVAVARLQADALISEFDPGDAGVRRAEFDALSRS